jgi:hypothetical protein
MPRDKPSADMSKPEVDERVRVLHHTLRQGIHAHEDNAKLVRQNQQCRNAA